MTNFYKPSDGFLGMEIPPLVVLGVCVLAISLIGLRLSLDMNEREARRKEEMLGRTSAYHVEDFHADVRCEICLDSMYDEPVSECVCGKVFHRSCAEPTGSCPYCGTAFERFAVQERRPRKLGCIRCGKDIGQNICECGTVIPFRDGTFYCTCGEVINEESEWCPNCGRTFERREIVVENRFLPDP